jgi:hypothetical protein
MLGTASWVLVWPFRRSIVAWMAKRDVARKQRRQDALTRDIDGELRLALHDDHLEHARWLTILKAGALRGTGGGSAEPCIGVSGRADTRAEIG